jgi:hypothetical protein
MTRLAVRAFSPAVRRDILLSHGRVVGVLSWRYAVDMIITVGHVTEGWVLSSEGSHHLLCCQSPTMPSNAGMSVSMWLALPIPVLHHLASAAVHGTAADLFTQARPDACSP